MSIFHRRSRGDQALFEPDGTPGPPPRMAYPRGAFASLVTDPPEAADEAYAAFMRFEMTPVLAEREINHLLADCDIACPVLEKQAMFRYALEQETTTNGRLRVIVHWLVNMQHSHESNRHALRTFAKLGTVRRVVLLPGCCPTCDRLTNRRFRLSSAPDLPLEGCQRHGGCICAWAPAID
jgi:hypothetical protein